MIDTFHDGGWGMYPTLFFGALALAAAAVYAMRPERRFVPLVVSTALLTMVSGMLGFVRGVSASFQHVTDAPDRAVAMVGVGESAHNVTLSLVFVALVLIATTVGALRGARTAATF
ncbi:MAG: hypothetical protein M3Y87_00530 [Myxococcota bacterium]|nr:hypothetical protein [Myxococcota bacterium]